MAASTSGPSSGSSLPTEHDRQAGTHWSAVSDGGAPSSKVDQHPLLPMAEVGAVNRQGQLRGMMSGIFSGVLSAMFVRNFMRRSANATVLTGLGVGVVMGYVSGYAQVKRGLVELERRKRDLQGNAAAAAVPDEMESLDLRAGQNASYEAGVAGLYDLRDRTHSTRGDH